MKYRLRSLMIVAIVAPPLLAWAYFAIQRLTPAKPRGYPQVTLDGRMRRTHLTATLLAFKGCGA